MDYKIIIKSADGSESNGKIASGVNAVFGRGADSDYSVNDALVSREHCRIEVSKDGSIYVRDLGSSNGTKVNGRLIKEIVEVSCDDIVDIGNTSIEMIPLIVEADEKKSIINNDQKDELDSSSVNFARKFDISKGPIDDLEEIKVASKDLALRLNSICNLAGKLNSERYERAIIDVAINVVLDISKAERCSVILSHESSNLLDPIASKYSNNFKEGETFKTSNTVVKYVIKTGESVITENAVEDDRFDVAESLMLNNVASVMCVPLATYDKILGVIYTDSTGVYGGDFDNSVLAVMAAAAHQVATAIERVRLHNGLEKMFFGSMLALAASIEAKDKYTKGHSERVTCYSLMIADELGISETERTVVELAGLLHDVGKIGVPEQILCSSGKLSDEEFEYIKNHPKVGSEIILKMPELGDLTSISEVAKTVLRHHERFDGTGYPNGLAGSRIPVSSRILTIADTFDALTSNRTYRKGMPVEKALVIMKDCAGTQLDPDILGAFIKVYERGELACPEKVRAHVAFDHELLRDNTVISG